MQNRIGKNRARLSLSRSNRYLFAQITDPESGKTILGLSDKNFFKEEKGKSKSSRAEIFGLEFAKLAVEKKVNKVVFDRGGRLYHGRVKAFAEGARKGGLQF